MLSVWKSGWSRAVAVVTVVVVGTTPALSSAATSRQLTAAGVGGATALSIAQTGPRDLVITNSGDAAVSFPGSKLRQLARHLKVDSSSACLTVKALAPGESCALRLRVSLRRHAAPIGVRVAKDAARTLTLTNTSTVPMRLAGSVPAPLLQRMGMGAGGCATLRTLLPSASCTLRAGTAAPVTSATDGLVGYQLATPEEWAKDPIGELFRFFGQLFVAWVLGCVLDPDRCLPTISF